MRSFVPALTDVWLKPDSYGFQSVKILYGRNLGRTPKSYDFLVPNMKLEIWSEVVNWLQKCWDVMKYEGLLIKTVTIDPIETGNTEKW